MKTVFFKNMNPKFLDQKNNDTDFFLGGVESYSAIRE
jgi:hypothetical protein